MTTTAGAALCLAVDPGKATGIALLRRDFKNDALVIEFTKEADFGETVTTVRDVLGAFPGVAVVGEKFTITPQTAMNTAAPWSLEVLGAVRALLVVSGRDANDLILQTPAAAKSFCTNQNLKDTGLWHKGGHGHALDALRHAVLYYASNGFVPPSLLVSKVTNS